LQDLTPVSDPGFCDALTGLSGGATDAQIVGNLIDNGAIVVDQS